jgi:hypothetical protein
MPEVEQEIKIGDLDDGGVYVGLSATDGKPLHAALADEPTRLAFDQALAAAAKMRKLAGRENAYVPTPEELNVNLYLSRDSGALKGTFKNSAWPAETVYRSGAPCATVPYNLCNAQVQEFKGGTQFSNGMNLHFWVRLVW